MSAEQAPVAYVPSQRLVNRDDEAVLELRRADDGRLAVLAYATLEELVASCGDHQPWICIPQTFLPELVARSGADGVAWEVVLDEGQQHGSDEVPPLPVVGGAITEGAVGDE